MPRAIHQLGKYDNDRFSNSRSMGWPFEEDEPPALARRLAVLLESQDPEDRRDADRLLYLLQCNLNCPDGIWVVQSEYLPDVVTGKRWSENIVTWSAHLSEEEAERWRTAWVRKWKTERPDYGMLPVHQENNIPLHYLRHPDADPSSVQYV